MDIRSCKKRKSSKRKMNRWKGIKMMKKENKASRMKDKRPMKTMRINKRSQKALDINIYKLKLSSNISIEYKAPYIDSN